MHPRDFDWSRFADLRARREERLRSWMHEPSAGPLLRQPAHSPFTRARTPEESLSVQLEGISKALAQDSDDLPYLEPWFGVGVYAEAFGCETVWVPGTSAQTHYCVHSIEEAEQLQAADLHDHPGLNLVRAGIHHFLDATEGRIPIAVTDTQSPIDTATLIWETTSFFEALYEAPEVVERVLDLITDAIIAGTDEQIALLGDTWARPGHIMAGCPDGPGLSLSDDDIVMLSPEHYSRFAVPWNERIGKRYGGLAVHSCGNYERQLAALLDTEGLIMIDGAFSRNCDPSPNTNRSHFREQMAGRGIILQARCGHDWQEVAADLLHPELPLVLVVPAPAEGEAADTNRRRLEALLAAV